MTYAILQTLCAITGILLVLAVLALACAANRMSDE